MSHKEKKYVPMKMPIKKKQEEEVTGMDADQTDDNKKEGQQKKAHLRMGKGGVEGLATNEDNIEFQGKTNKQQIAMDILRQGYIQSYIDFFYITNPGKKEGDDIEKSGKFLSELKEDRLLDLKQSLMQAEEYTKYVYPDKAPAIEGYKNLADKFFYDYKEFSTAAYFYKKVISIAKHAGDRLQEGKGKLGFGKCYDQLEKTQEAIVILEKSMQEAEELQDQDIGDQLVTEISKELIVIYKKVAESFEKGDNESVNNALIYFEKCLEVAKKSERDEDEGAISHKIGLLHFKNGNFSKAIDYQKKYLEINISITTEEGRQRQMEAHAALAKCYLRLNLNDDAQQHLEKYIEHAEKLHQNNAQSDAALHLATLYAQKGNVNKSLEYYKLHFDGARTEKADKKDRKLVDRARVTYGIAKANANIKNYIDLVANSGTNLKALLDWKSKKDK